MLELVILWCMAGEPAVCGQTTVAYFQRMKLTECAEAGDALLSQLRFLNSGKFVSFKRKCEAIDGSSVL